ncbi:hypothetical protein KCP69_09800 [Salmonella enterica subsp. enterica]|nr:hypothetical protein KCP69_09800 [Salmonella enterica subsp. enterica]
MFCCFAVYRNRTRTPYPAAASHAALSVPPFAEDDIKHLWRAFDGSFQPRRLFDCSISSSSSRSVSYSIKAAGVAYRMLLAGKIRTARVKQILARASKGDAAFCGFG